MDDCNSFRLSPCSGDRGILVSRCPLKLPPLFLSYPLKFTGQLSMITIIIFLYFHHMALKHFLSHFHLHQKLTCEQNSKLLLLKLSDEELSRSSVNVPFNIIDPRYIAKMQNVKKVLAKILKEIDPCVDVYLLRHKH